MQISIRSARPTVRPDTRLSARGQETRVDTSIVREPTLWRAMAEQWRLVQAR